MRVKSLLRIIFLIRCLLLCTAAFASSSPQMRFVAISDIHFTPFASCEEQTPCETIELLRQAPAEDWDAILALKDKSAIQSKDETNYLLLSSMLRDVYQKSVVQKPTFVLVSGDFLAHGYRGLYQHFSTDKTEAGYQEFVNKTMTFLMLQFKSHLGKQNVFVAIGNNDTYQDHYVINFDDSFFKNMGEIWSNAITDDNIKSVVANEMATAGYYASTLPQQPNLRLIVLNSVLFSAQAQGNSVDVVANNQLAWLHQQLEFAKAFNQKALIVMHIPDGVDAFSTASSTPFSIKTFWQQEYSERFEADLVNYSDNIVGVLAAHDHGDWMRVLHGGNNQLVAMSGVPSVSPVFGNNPAYKIYSIATDELTLSDFVTYTFPLNASSADGWIKEYDFDQTYQPKCKYCAVIDAMTKLQATGDAINNYKKFYTTGMTTDTQYKFMPFYWCAVNHLDSNGYQQCLDDTIKSHI